jgi:hypothetical protein
MKKTGIILMLIAIALQVSGQETTKEKIGETQLAVASDTNESTKVVIGKDLIKVEEGKNEVRVKVGNRGLNILESLEGPKFAFEKFSNDNNDYQSDEKGNDSHHRRNKNHFSGHWAGVEFGFDNYLTEDRTIVMPADIDYMTLNTTKSSCFNINFVQQSIGFTRHIGLVTGLGLNWSNYNFDNNNNIREGDLGVIEEFDPGTALKKSKLKTWYMTLPIMLEFQIPTDNHQLNLDFGIIGAVKLGSHTKMVYEEGTKIKSHDDFSLSMLRYGPTVRIGYSNFNIYSTYYLTPLFQKGKSPGGYNLYPVELGIAFTFRD